MLAAKKWTTEAGSVATPLLLIASKRRRFSPWVDKNVRPVTAATYIEVSCDESTLAQDAQRPTIRAKLGTPVAQVFDRNAWSARRKGTRR